MPKQKRSPEAKERLKKLRKLARQTVNRMDEHKLFAFILLYRGKRAIPHLVELWEEGPLQDEKEEPIKEGMPPKEDIKPSDELIELVAKKSKKG